MVTFSKRPPRSRSLAVVRGVRLETVRDVRGFHVGVVVNPAVGQASVCCTAHTSADGQPVAWQQWDDTVSRTESVSATTVSIHLAREPRVVLWTTFSAEGKAERKDTSEFLTRLARILPDVYDCADVVADPLDAEAMGRMIAEALMPGSSSTSFPPPVRGVKESPGHISMGGQTTATFELDLPGAAADTVTEVVGILDTLTHRTPEVSARVAVWSRPAVENHDSARRVGLVSLSAPDMDLVTTSARWMIDMLTPALRLRCRRLWNRQQMGAVSSLGVGVAGWQHLEVLP